MLMALMDKFSSASIGGFKESLIVKEPLSELFEDLAVGMELDGEEDGFAILSANHELAGVTLRVSGKVIGLE